MGIIDNYFKSVFPVPLMSLIRLESLRSSFFWGEDFRDRKEHRVRWEDKALSRKYGGLGISSLYALIFTVQKLFG